MTIIEQITQDLETSWRNSNCEIHILKSDKDLWHSGIIDFAKPKVQEDAIWFGIERERQDEYVGFAKSGADYLKIPAYKYHLSSQQDLNLAIFSNIRFSHIVMKYGAKHSDLNVAISKFCIKNNLDGIFYKDDCDIALRNDRVSLLTVKNSQLL